MVVSAVLGAGALVLVVNSAPALACSCALGSTGDHVENADVIVTGTLTDAIDPPAAEVMSSDDPITYLVDVEKTFKGDASHQLEFTSAMSGASCGLEGMQVGDRYAFFLYPENKGLEANLCGGTAPSTPKLERQIAHWTGPPREPAAGVEPASSPTSTRIDDDEPAQSAAPTWLVVSGAVAGALALAIVLTVAFRRRSVTGQA